METPKTSEDLAAAVLASDAGRICVIAAPGNGKTRRILIPKAKAILQTGVDPAAVLLLTFSRLSAIDLRQKLGDLAKVSRAATVHSYCLAFLMSEDNHEIRKRVDSIILDFERDVLVADLQMVLPDVGRRKLKKELEKFSAGWATEPHDRVYEESEEQRRFKAAVVNWLSEHEAAMMDEIVYFAVDVARRLPDAKLIAEPRFILVDEFQDLNKLEQEFIELLAAKSNLLLVVGDPDQSIYSFKYAHPQGMNEFAERSGVETYRDMRTGRCPRQIVAIANQFLLQSKPDRTSLLEATKRDEGELALVQKNDQPEEFEHVLSSISGRLRQGSKPSRIVVLVPRTKLGTDFAEYAGDEGARFGVPEGVQFRFVLKPEFSERERERILLLGIAARPESLVHARAYLGLAEPSYFAKEIGQLKTRYGNLRNALEKARAEEFPARSAKIREVCARAQRIREFVSAHREPANVNSLLDELFPPDDADLAIVREILVGLKEDDDTPQRLYSKFVDYVRSVPFSEQTVRVMSLRASKGLEAEHVYMLGCNAGNIPGPNRSSHMSDYEHREEQRRLLYVGATRASESLMISWSRRIPFKQAKGHYTPSIGTRRRGGEVQSLVGICDFLQDLRDVVWDAF
jgi:DNA helicase-2/ATP-dependent DNA helicase PcrA